MKKILYIFLISLLPFSSFAQKVTVHIAVTKGVAAGEWQITDEQYGIIQSGSRYPEQDTVTFSLEANRRYFLRVSVRNAEYPDTTLYSLLIGGEPVLLIRTGLSSGYHEFPFFTGIKSADTKIIGGSTARISDVPWQVFFVAANQQCGGSLISPEWVVTAAHCVLNSKGVLISPESMYIKAGAASPDDRNSGKTYLVSDAIVHERYNDATNENDIALIRLKEPVTVINAAPVKLISAQDSIWGYTDPGVMAWISGWGLTSVNPEVSPSVLQKAQVPIVSNSQAAVIWKDIPLSDIMAGYRNGDRDACMGDSGGPLVVPVAGQYKLAGIVSWGSQKCDTYGAYTRVSSFESWIRKKTGISAGPVSPPPVGDTLVCQGETSTGYHMRSVPDATAYEWMIYPSEAGVIVPDNTDATVFWSPEFTGRVKILLRITVDGRVSDWTELNANRARNTRLLGQTGDATACAGENVKLSVTAEGNNLFYKWYKNGNVIQAGRSNEFYISGASPVDNGNYKCEIIGNCGTVVSAIMVVTIHPLTMITYITPDPVVKIGDDAELDVVSQGDDLVYYWYKDGKMTVSGSTPRLILENVNANDIGTYKVNVTGTCGSSTSEQVYLFVTREEKHSDTEVLVWPTVTRDEFHVAPGNEQYYNIILFSIGGKYIKELNQCRYQTTINISELPRGMYIVNVFNRNFRISYKVIKQ